MLFEGQVPGYTRLVAHCVREIRNRLPAAISGATAGGRVDYKNRLDTIASAWQKAGIPDLIEQVVDRLKARRWCIFQRLSLHIVREFGAQAPDLVSEWLRDPARFDVPSTRREYSLLAQKFFGSLGYGDKEAILKWIDTGLAFDSIKSRLSSFLGREVSDDEVLTGSVVC